MDADDSHLEQRIIENEQRLYAQEKLFYDNMEKYASAKNSKMITGAEKGEIISTLRNWETLSSKTKDGKRYGWKTKYDFVQLGNAEPILYRKSLKPAFTDTAGNFLLDKVVREVTFEELFQCLHEVHLSVGHGKVRKMEPAIKLKYSNIGRKAIEVYCETCSRCVESAPREQQRAGYRPIITKGFNRRGQIDLIDMQSNPKGGMSWLAVYQDHGLKFAYFRALPDKKATTVAKFLLEIFCIQGAPVVLQSDNGREFVNGVVEALKSVYPGLKIVHGRVRHSQSQGSVERLNRTVEGLIYKFVADNPGSDWVQSVPFIQLTYNTRRHDGTQKAPYELVYGSQPRLGLCSLGIPDNVLTALIVGMDSSSNGRNEEDLLLLLEDMGVGGDAITDPQLDNQGETGGSGVPACEAMGDVDLASTSIRQPVVDSTASFASPELIQAGQVIEHEFVSQILPNSPIDFDNFDVTFQELVEQTTARVELMSSPTEDDTMMAQQVFGFPTDYLRTALLPPPPVGNIFDTAPATSSIDPTAGLSEPVPFPSDYRLETEPGMPNIDSGHFTLAVGGEVVANPVSPQSHVEKSPLVSPRRALLRREAMNNLVKQARKMQWVASKHSDHDIIPVGTIVRIAAPDVDRARADPASIVAVIVETTQKGMYRLATAHGVITPMFYRGAIDPVPSTNPSNHNLQSVLANWATMPKISVPTAVRKQSLFGGQGFLRCNCKGNCEGGRCNCKKQGKLCGSRCHKSLTCSNK